MFYAWINNTDAKYSNTLDMFNVTNPLAQTGYVKHYLIDFGTSFGGGPGGPKPRFEGYEYKVDWAGMGQRLANLLGIHRGGFHRFGLGPGRISSSPPLRGGIASAFR